MFGSCGSFLLRRSSSTRPPLFERRLFQVLSQNPRGQRPVVTFRTRTTTRTRTTMTTNNIGSTTRQEEETVRPEPQQNNDRSFAEWDRQQEDAILQEAGFLSRSLYRTCFRSAKLLRHPNAQDELEFAQREEEQYRQQEKFLEAKQVDDRLDFLSMLPPVNRPDELRSRLEYYCEYTRDEFVTERNCFHEESTSPGGRRRVVNEENFKRYLHCLTRGDQYRKWLLKDMKFPDPYEKTALDQDRIEQLRQQGEVLFQKRQEQEQQEQARRSKVDPFWRQLERIDDSNQDELELTSNYSDQDSTQAHPDQHPNELSFHDDDDDDKNDEDDDVHEWEVEVDEFREFYKRAATAQSTTNVTTDTNDQQDLFESMSSRR